jgi:hypothetical protein
MSANAAMMPNVQAGGIYEADSTASSKTVLEIDAQDRCTTARAPLASTPQSDCADQAWKCRLPIHTNVVLVERFEGTVMLLVAGVQNRHDFTDTA